MLKYTNVERVIHSLKTAIACLLGFLLTKIISFPADQWIVITIVVVMCAQLYVGSVVQKSYMRFLGTITGCIFAAIGIFFFGNNHIATACIIAVSTFAFSYLATSKESLSTAGTLGAVTTVIILLAPTPSLLYAGERFLEISLGLLIATVVSQFVLPIHARTHLRRAQAQTLTLLRDYYLLVMNGHADPINYSDLDEDIVKSLIKQRDLAKESKNEPLGLAFNPQHISQMLYNERQMLRATTFMHDALSHVSEIPSAFMRTGVMQAFNQNIVNAFNVLIAAVTATNTTLIHLPNLSIDGLINEMHHFTSVLRVEEKMYMDGFLFSAEILTVNLQKIAVLYQLGISDEVVEAKME